MSCTPPGVATPPLALGWRAGGAGPPVSARPRAAGHPAGGARWGHARAGAVWAHDGLDRRGPHRDPTRVALRRAEGPDSAAPARPMTPGAADDHRPALTPAVVGLWGAHVGRARPGRPRGVDERAAAHRSPAAHAARFRPLGGRPRLPQTLQRVAPARTHALTWTRGHCLAATPRAPRRECGHAGRAQRWRVGSAAAARARAEARVRTAPPRAWPPSTTPLARHPPAWPRLRRHMRLARPRGRNGGPRRRWPPTACSHTRMRPARGGRITHSWPTTSPTTPVWWSAPRLRPHRAALQRGSRPLQGTPRPRAAGACAKPRSAATRRWWSNRPAACTAGYGCCPSPCACRRGRHVACVNHGPATTRSAPTRAPHRLRRRPCGGCATGSTGGRAATSPGTHAPSLQGRAGHTTGHQPSPGWEAVGQVAHMSPSEAVLNVS